MSRNNYDNEQFKGSVLNELSKLDTKVRQEYKQWDNFPLISIEPQRTVEKGKKKYRVDIALDCSFKGKNHSFAIECDGHEFHEKTKEQAARDKQRDRDLQSLGYRALRFTGSEIWNRPSKCAYDALKIVEKVTGIYDEEMAYLQRIYPDNNWL